MTSLLFPPKTSCHRFLIELLVVFMCKFWSLAIITPGYTVHISFHKSTLLSSPQFSVLLFSWPKVDVSLYFIRSCFCSDKSYFSLATTGNFPLCSLSTTQSDINVVGLILVSRCSHNSSGNINFWPISCLLSCCQVRLAHLEPWPSWY